MKRSRPCAGSFRFRPRSNLGELAGAYSWAIVGGITRHKIRDKHASASAKRSKRKPSYRRHSNRRSERPIRSSKIRSLLSVGIRALCCAECAVVGMNMECPWCSSPLPPAGKLEPASNTAKRAAKCPSCQKAIRVSRKEQFLQVLALPLGIAYGLDFFELVRLPGWLLIVLAISLAIALVKIRSIKPERVNAV